MRVSIFEIALTFTYKSLRIMKLSRFRACQCREIADFRVVPATYLWCLGDPPNNYVEDQLVVFIQDNLEAILTKSGLYARWSAELKNLASRIPGFHVDKSWLGKFERDHLIYVRRMGLTPRFSWFSFWVYSSLPFFWFSLCLFMSGVYRITQYEYECNRQGARCRRETPCHC